MEVIFHYPSWIRTTEKCCMQLQVLVLITVLVKDVIVRGGEAELWVKDPIRREAAVNIREVNLRIIERKAIRRRTP
jgi:hypothetical protein